MHAPSLFVKPQLGREALIVDRQGRAVATVHAQQPSADSAELAAQMAMAPLLAQALGGLLDSLDWHVRQHGAMGMDSHRLAKARELLMLSNALPPATPLAAKAREAGLCGLDSAWDLPGYDH